MDKPHLRKMKGTGNWICEGSGIVVWGWSVVQAYRLWKREADRGDWRTWYDRASPVLAVQL